MPCGVIAKPLRGRVYSSKVRMVMASSRAVGKALCGKCSIRAAAICTAIFSGWRAFAVFLPIGQIKRDTSMLRCFNCSRKRRALDSEPIRATKGMSLRASAAAQMSISKAWLCVITNTAAVGWNPCRIMRFIIAR